MVDSLRGVRVARVSTVPYFVATQLKRQLEYLATLGARIFVITAQGPELSSFQWTDNLALETIDIPRSFHPLRDLAALIRLLRSFYRHGFDIVHSTTPKAGLLCAVAAWICRIPVRLHTFTGQPWVALGGPMRLMALWADRLIGMLNTHCYADSPSQREFLIAEGIIPAPRISVIGAGSLAGVDLQRFDASRWDEAAKAELRRALGVGATSRIIVFVGRITRDKGVGELLEAFRAVVAEGFDVFLLLVGHIDEERGGAIALDLDDAAYRDRLRHVGYTACPEQYTILADFLCLPSYREGFGTVVIEAAALGVPTLGTRIYGLTDAVVDGVTGRFVPPRDAKALAEAMRDLLGDRELLARMGEAARQRCLAEFDAAVVNARLAEEYVRWLGTRYGK